MLKARAEFSGEDQAMFDSVTVTAAARLHLGFLDMNGGLGRRFGSLGLSIDASTRLTIRRAATGTTIDGSEASRAARYLELLTRHFGLSSAYALTIHDAIPAHAGLGSGTQLALAIGAALAASRGLPANAADDALLLRRGARSGIGLGLFERGGLIVDGGHGERTTTPPVIARLDFPPQWRVILVLDPRTAGVHGGEENATPSPHWHISRRAAAAEICRLVLIKALPALAEQDIGSFGDAIARLQEIVGDYFAPAQGGSALCERRRGRSDGGASAARGDRNRPIVLGANRFCIRRRCEQEAHDFCESVHEKAAALGLDIAICKGVNHGALVEGKLLRSRQQIGENTWPKNILHMLSPFRHMSPFDVNMALDAGYDSVTPYIDVTLDEVTPLVQDAMFSRSPRDAVRTCVFIAGKDAVLALDMLERLQGDIVEAVRDFLFRRSRRVLHDGCRHGRLRREDPEEKERQGARQIAKFVIFGATGAVGYTSGVIAALEGAEVTLTGYDGAARFKAKADDIKQRFGVHCPCRPGKHARRNVRRRWSTRRSCFARRLRACKFSQRKMLASAKSLLVAADVNAVPPAGIEGLELMANGVELPGGSLGIGPLAIGDVKYKTESGLFQRMATSSKAISLDFRDAFSLAREIA